MSRLPTVGGDNNNWGDVLNDYLSVSHQSDGTLQKQSIESSLTGDISSHTHSEFSVNHFTWDGANILFTKLEVLSVA